MPLIKKLTKKLFYICSLSSLIGFAVAPIFMGLAIADNVVDGFNSSQALQPGLIVSLSNATTRTVAPASINKPGSIYGVVVDPSDAPITLVNQNSQVFVATSGTYQVLVSLANGPIKTGDYLSLSPTDGIGAKAVVSEPTVIGRAATAFNGSSNVVTTANGKPVGRIYVNIAIQKNPLVNTDPSLPSALTRVANGLADKSVPVIRVYTAILIFMISILATLTIIWSGVRSSLISLGRNPLSRKTIFSGMYKTVFTGIGVFIIGVAGVYLLLKI
jgi:hypothetical protein